MIVVETRGELCERVAALRAAGKRIAFVPTMGNLHAGHLRLIREARSIADAVIASIFVNPMQFGQDEDFGSYPRTFTEDQAALAVAHVDLLFNPSVDTVYPRGQAAQTFVEVPGLSDTLCGASRPGHFRGVTTVVNRLFNLVAPDVALFGKKDYQQLLIIRLMVADLAMPVEIVGVETVREADGLAMSSRNAYLSSEERRLAPTLYATLCGLRDQIVLARRILPGAADEVMQALAGAGFRPDYLSIRRQADLQEAGPDDRKLVILAAAYLGGARLIDNIELDLNPGG